MGPRPYARLRRARGLLCSCQRYQGARTVVNSANSERLPQSMRPGGRSSSHAPLPPWGERLASPVERVSQASAWVVLAIALLVSFLIWAWTARQAAESLTATIQSASKEMAQSISNHMATYELLARGAAGLFHGEAAPDRKRWASYAADLAMSSNLPGIQALAYAVRLDASER